MSRRHRTSKGQALVLITLSLLAMSGLMGLAVDLGWMFFLKKEAQAAADSGALAAVEEAKTRLSGAFSGFTCPGTSNASTPWCQATQLNCSSFGLSSSGTSASPSQSNLYDGCVYAAKNGFNTAANAQQTVWIEANAGGATTMPPGLTACTGSGSPAPCYDPKSVAYWVTVSTVQTVPQLFSAVLGNPQGVISATATAAIISTVVPGQFIALNTPGAAINAGSGGSTHIVYGEDVDLSGSSSINVPGGVLLSSTCTGSSQPGCSGVGTITGGSSSLCSGSGCPSVGNGSVQIPVAGAAAGANGVSPTPVVGGGPFTDPYQGVPQPPLVPTSGSIGSCGIPGGNITGGTASHPLILGPFQYYATTSPTNTTPTGAPITLSGGNIAFDPNSTVCGSIGSIVSQAGSAATGAFSAFYFYGGLNVNTTTYFGPGEYVSVGANSGNAAAGVVLTMGASNITGSGTGTGTGVNAPAAVPPGVTTDTGAGTLFVMTDPNYSAGLNASPPASVSGLVDNLGTFSMQAGNNSSISLAGLDRSVASVPASLDQYNGLLMWQDRADSTLDYNAMGTLINPSTGQPLVWPSSGPSPCTPVGMSGSAASCNPNAPTPTTLNAETMSFQAHPNMNLAGVIYQPQGATFNFTGHGGMTSALQIITGAVVMTGGGSLSLTSDQNPAIRYIVGLIH